jgi:hypothetical protein
METIKERNRATSGHMGGDARPTAAPGNSGVHHGACIHGRRPERTDSGNDELFERTGRYPSPALPPKRLANPERP